MEFAHPYHTINQQRGLSFWHCQMHAVSGASLQCPLAAAGIGLTQVGRHVEAHNSAQLAGCNGLAQAQEGGDAPVVLGHAPERGWLQALGGRGGYVQLTGAQLSSHMAKQRACCSRLRPVRLSSTFVLCVQGRGGSSLLEKKGS